MISNEQIRQLALALPQSIEQDHHGRPSFRVAGRIFATLWDSGHMNVMLDGAGIRTAVQANPGVCEEFWWGKRLRATQVDLTRATAALAGELLADAWEQKATNDLRTEWLAGLAAMSPPAEELVHKFHLDDEDLLAWEESRLPEVAFVDWLTDRVARRPAGKRARETYGAEDIHDFARRAILEALRLRAGEHLLEIGCGGGLLLRDALATGASATGLDHSLEMVELARQRAPGAEVRLGRAESLPFEDRAFDAVAMSIVFFFIPEPHAALGESLRVLRPGGRLAVYTTSPKLRGTPAAPEPLASQCFLHESDELSGLARNAGFIDVSVRDDGGQLLTARREG